MFQFTGYIFDKRLQDNLMHLGIQHVDGSRHRRIRQCFFRWLNNFRADGPIPVTSTFDHGFENRITAFDCGE